jgi:hypothetical protein
MSRVQYDEGICFVPGLHDRDFTKEERAELRRIAKSIPGVRADERNL